MATELAKAYVQIIPSAQGIQGSIASVMNGEGASAGESAGQSFASSFGSMAKKALVGLGIGKIIKDAIGDTSEFETGMAKVSTLFAGTGEELKQLQDDILGLSSAYGISVTELTEAAYSAESAGVAQEDLIYMLEHSAELAKAGFADLDTALAATAKTMNAYGDAAGSAEDIQKVLIQTQNLGITTVGELGASLANVTPTAAAMGVSFEQIGAAMAELTATGVPTAQATTQLRAAMSELGKAGTKADKAFREAAKGTEFAGKSFQEAMASGADLGDVFGLMQAYADKTGKSMVDLWGSVEAGNAAMVIAGDLETFNRNLDAMATEADVVGDAYGKMANTFGNDMNRLKESAKNFMTTLFTGGDISASFDQMLGSLGDIGERLKTWLTNGLKGLADNLPQLMGSLLDFGGSILESLAQVDWIELGTSILNGIIGALGTLGTKLIELVKNAISSVVNGDISFGDIGTKIIEGVKSVFTTAGNWLGKLFEAARDAIWGENGVDFGEIGRKIIAGVKTVLDEAGQFLAELFGFGRDAASSDDMGYSGIGTKILEGIKTVLDAGGEFLGNLFKEGIKASENQGWPSLGQFIKMGVNLGLNGGRFLSATFAAGAKLIEGMNWYGIGESLGNAVIKGINAAGDIATALGASAVELIENIQWDDIGTSIGSLLVNGIDIANNLLTAAGNATVELVNNIPWDSLGKSIGSLLVNGIDIANNLLTAAGNAVVTLIDNIPWDGVGQSIGNLLINGINIANDLLTAVSNAALGLIDGVPWGDIGHSIGGLFITGINIANDLLTAVGNAALALIEGVPWGDIGRSISGLFIGGIDAATSLLNTMKTAGEGLITGIEWKGIGKSISDAISEGITGAGNLLGGLLSGAGSAVEGAGNLIGEVFSFGEKGLSALSDALFGSDLAALKQATTDLEQAMTNLESVIKNGKVAIEEAAKKVGESIRDGIANELTQSKMEDIGYSAGENAMIGIDRGILIEETTVYDEIASVRKRVSNNFAAPTQWNDAGKKAMDKLADGIKAKFDKIKKGFEVLRGYGVETMMDESVWKSVGSNIVYGIVAGVHSAASSLEAAMKKIAKRALAAAKDELGISSPSKVMADQVGRWIPEGIAMGIERNADIVSDAMGELAEDSTLRPMTEMLARQPAGWSMETSHESQDDSESRFAEAIERALNRVNVYLGAEKVGRITSGWVDQDIKAGDAALLRGMGG